MKTLLKRYCLLLALCCLVSASPTNDHIPALEQHVEFRLRDKETSYRGVSLTGRPETIVIDVITGPIHFSKGIVWIDLPEVYQSLNTLSVHVDIKYAGSSEVDKYSLMSNGINPIEHKETEVDGEPLWPTTRSNLYWFRTDIEQPGFTMTLKISGDETELMSLADKNFVVQVNTVNTDRDNSQAWHQALQDELNGYDDECASSSSSCWS